MESVKINNKNISSEPKKYTVYSNDLKFKKHRNIDPEKAHWDNENVKKKFYQNNLDTLEYRFNECKKNNFEYLDLSNLGLSKIPKFNTYDNFSNIKNIKFLFLNDNKLTEINKELLCFLNLKVLDISSNKLHKINDLPKTIEELVCHNNNLTSIPEHNEVIKIDCSYNDIKNLNKYPNLIDIICDNNKIEHINTYNNVTRIICKNNPLTSIDYQPSMKYFDCSTTKLVGKLPTCPNLKFLVCNYTKINDISNLNELVSLEIIGSSVLKIPYILTLRDLLYQNTQNVIISSKYKIVDYIKERDNSYLKFDEYR